MGGSGLWPLWATHSWVLTHRETSSSSCLLSTFGPCSCGCILPPPPLPSRRSLQLELLLMALTHPGLWKLRPLQSGCWFPCCVTQSEGGKKTFSLGGCPWLRAVNLNRGDFAPRGTFGNVWRQFSLLQLAVFVCPAILLALIRVEARDVAKHTTVNKTAPITKNH